MLSFLFVRKHDSVHSNYTRIPFKVEALDEASQMFYFHERY